MSASSRRLVGPLAGLAAALAAPAPAPAGPCDRAPPAWGGATPDAPDPCLAADLEIAGELRRTDPAAGVSQQFRLPRSRLELALGDGQRLSARVATVAVRSGGETGYVGVAGESIVPILQIAEARGELPRIGLAAAMGLVDDPWVIEGQDRWGLPAIAAPLALDQGWMDRADLGGWAAWTAPAGLATVTLAGLSGEGLSYRERNDGKNVSAQLTARPLALGALGADLLEISVFYRDGSRGLSYARDHRAGGRVAANHRWVSGGIEALAAWGLEGDPSVEPGGGSLWVRTGPELPALGWIRADYALADRTRSRTATTILRAGGGPALEGGELYLVAGVEVATFERNAAPLAGATDAADHRALFLQLGAGASGAVSLEPH